MYNIGATIADRYVVEAVVGHGGMGTIYRAQDTRLGRTVAIKVLRPDLAADPNACARFLREGQIAAQMVHTNVVRTYDAGEDTSGPFLVQELLSGRTLDALIPLPPQRAASILSDIASALAYIHHRGYLHCDIKPTNILLKQDGTPVLLDFGIARAEGADATTLIATPHYLAPERAQGGPPTIAADLYALGIVLYQSIEGHPPFDASSIPAIIQQHTTVPVPPLTIASPATPVLDAVIARLTAKQPSQRYTLAETVKDDLAAVARNAGHAFPTVAVAAAVPGASANHAASPPVLPRPPSQHIQQAVSAWSNMPAWRKRRWLAGIVGFLFVISLGYVLARGERADVQGAPNVPQPAIVEPLPSGVDAANEQDPMPVATQPVVEQPVIIPVATQSIVQEPAPSANDDKVESDAVENDEGQPQEPGKGKGKGKEQAPGKGKDRDKDG